MGTKQVKRILLRHPAAICFGSSTNTPNLFLAQCASVCYNSERLRSCNEEEAIEFLNKIVDNGHLGVLEHVTMTFEVFCSRSCSHQFERHRVGFSYLEVSQRHVTPDGDPTAMWTDELTLKQTAYVQRQLAQAYANSMYVYKALVRKGIPKEIARYALPEMTTTRVIVTANLRAWRDFLSKRLPKAAQSEIRMLAHLIYRHIQVYCPSAVRGLKVSK